MSRDITKLSKLAGGVPSSKLKAPPNSCIPSRAKMRMKRNRRNRRDRMERIELSNDITRFRNEDQYLVKNKESNINAINLCIMYNQHIIFCRQLVKLPVLKLLTL